MKTYQITHWTQETWCFWCGWPLTDIGDRVYMDASGDTFCSRSCAHDSKEAAHMRELQEAVA